MYSSYLPTYDNTHTSLSSVLLLIHEQVYSQHTIQTVPATHNPNGPTRMHWHTHTHKTVVPAG